MFSKYVLPLLVFFAFSLNLQAQEKPTLNIYTYDSFASDWGAAPLLKEKFEQKCNCIINWVASSSSIGALRKIQLEANNPKADILLGIDQSVAGEARATGLFVEHKIDLSAILVPNNWSSEVFVPFDYGYFAFIYNKEKLSSPPNSFKDLINSNVKILIQDPRSSTTGLGLVLWIKSAFKENASNIWSKLAPKIVTITKGWSESYNLFLKGEADLVLSYTTSPAYHMIVEKDENYQAATFSEGSYVQIEVASILQSSTNKQLAREFLRWLISPEAQAIIPTTNWMYPVAKTPLPIEFEKLTRAKNVLLFDDKIVFENKQAWMQEMLDALK